MPKIRLSSIPQRRPRMVRGGMGSIKSDDTSKSWEIEKSRDRKHVQKGTVLVWERSWIGGKEVWKCTVEQKNLKDVGLAKPCAIPVDRSGK